MRAKTDRGSTRGAPETMAMPITLRMAGRPGRQQSQTEGDRPDHERGHDQSSDHLPGAQPPQSSNSQLHTKQETQAR